MSALKFFGTKIKSSSESTGDCQRSLLIKFIKKILSLVSRSAVVAQTDPKMIFFRYLKEPFCKFKSLSEITGWFMSLWNEKITKSWNFRKVPGSVISELYHITNNFFTVNSPKFVDISNSNDPSYEFGIFQCDICLTHCSPQVDCVLFVIVVAHFCETTKIDLLGSLPDKTCYLYILQSESLLKVRPKLKKLLCNFWMLKKLRFLYGI